MGHITSSPGCAPTLDHYSDRDLTEQGAGFREQLSEAAVEDASQILSQLQVLDLILPDGNVGGPERWNTQIGHT